MDFRDFPHKLQNSTKGHKSEHRGGEKLNANNEIGWQAAQIRKCVNKGQIRLTRVRERGREIRTQCDGIQSVPQMGAEGSWHWKLGKLPHGAVATQPLPICAPNAIYLGCICNQCQHNRDTPQISLRRRRVTYELCDPAPRANIKNSII